jgi:aspartate 1-decarboxylase
MPPRGSGVILLNGSLARRAHVGDHLIFCAYGAIAESGLPIPKPMIVLAGRKTILKKSRLKIATKSIAAI